MASTSALFVASPIRRFEPIPRTNYQPRRHSNVTTTTTFARRREVHDQNFGGRDIVDENMIVLRKRIREIERDDNDNNDEEQPPTGWMGWEKDIYPSYDMIICDAMRLLQSYLMETRPCFALGMLGLIALSVPISSAVVLFNLLELGRGVFSALHVS